jgi:hypothetical protein
VAEVSAQDGKGPDNVQDASSAVSLVREHLPLLVGIISTLFIAIRILSAAGFDPETAYAIIQAGGAASVILGAALSSVGEISLIIALISAERYFFHPQTTVVGRHLNTISLIVSGIVCLFTAPAFILLFIGFIVTMYFLAAYIVQPSFKWLLGFPSYEEERTEIRNALLTRDPNLMKRAFVDPEKRQKPVARTIRWTVSSAVLAWLLMQFFHRHGCRQKSFLSSNHRQ